MASHVESVISCSLPLLVWLNRLTQADALKVEPLDEPRGSPEQKCYAFYCHRVDEVIGSRQEYAANSEIQRPIS